MRLVTKGLLLLLVPTVAQAGLLFGFYMLHREKEFYPLRAMQDSAIADTITRFFLVDFLILHDLSGDLKNNVPVGNSESDHLSALRQETNTLTEEYRSFSDRRRPLLVFPEEQRLERIQKDYNQRCKWLEQIEKTTEAAVNSTKEVQVTAERASSSIRSEDVIQTGMNYLGGIANFDSSGGGDPEQSSRERDAFRILLALCCLINWLTLAIAIVLFSRNISSRLSKMLHNVQKFKIDVEPSGIVDGADEIARIDRTFHSLFVSLRETMFPHTSMMEHAQDLITLIDVHGRVLSVSNSAIRLLGYGPKELIGIRLTNLVSSDFQELTAQKLLQVRTGSEVLPFETRFVRDDKTVVDILLSLTWSAQDGEIFCVAHDITQTKATEQLQQDVMHMVSHDLKTPLAAISNFHQLLEVGILGELSAKNLEQVRRAQRSTERMLTLIKDLLDIERMKSGMLELELEPKIVRLDQVIAHSIESVEALAEKASISIIRSATDLDVFADQSRLIQILINLLSNAIKFSPQNTTISITAERDDQFTSLTVSDQGRGIPEDLLLTIFDRFSQTRASDATVYGGTGLGLSICKALAELHGGDLKVTSVVGQGSIFKFRIPNNDSAEQVKISL
jgi:PAS domain S-box-containing protein